MPPRSWFSDVASTPSQPRDSSENRLSSPFVSAAGPVVLVIPGVADLRVEVTVAKADRVDLATLAHELVREQGTPRAEHPNTDSPQPEASAEQLAAIALLREERAPGAAPAEVRGVGGLVHGSEVALPEQSRLREESCLGGAGSRVRDRRSRRCGQQQ